MARLQRSRELIAKGWLVDVVLDTPLADAGELPTQWAAAELPELIGEILTSVASGPRPSGGLSPQRVHRLAELRAGVADAAQLNHEIAALHARLVGALGRELSGSDPELFAECAQRLAIVFGELAGSAAQALLVHSQPAGNPLNGLPGAVQMRGRLEQLVAAQRRYEQPFSLVMLGVEAPGGGSPEEGGAESALAVVAGALRRTIRAADEPFRVEEDELGVLAPSQSAEQAEQMAHRVAQALAHLEEVGTMPIAICAGVAGCPEHGSEPERLVEVADTAMWRARATGRPVVVGIAQDR